MSDRGINLRRLDALRGALVVDGVVVPFVALLSAALFHSGGRPLDGWFTAGGAIAATLFGGLCFELCERHFPHRRIAPAKLAV